jgi:hypothetical protein
MRELGYIERKNMVIDVRWAEGQERALGAPRN